MNDFVSITDSNPEHDIPKQAVKQSKILFIKGLIIGICLTICISGIVQFIIKLYNNEYIQYAVYIWFNINEWTWIIGFIVFMFLTVKTIIRKYNGR